jgi:hypothetical protein
MLNHTSAFQGADEQTRRRLFFMRVAPLEFSYGKWRRDTPI